MWCSVCGVVYETDEPESHPNPECKVHWVTVEMDEVPAPQRWSQNVWINAQGLDAALGGLLHVSEWDMNQTKQSKHTFSKILVTLMFDQVFFWWVWFSLVMQWKHGQTSGLAASTHDWSHARIGRTSPLQLHRAVVQGHGGPRSRWSKVTVVKGHSAKTCQQQGCDICFLV